MGLCALYPQYMFPIQLLVCLEIAGPLSHLYRYLWTTKNKCTIPYMKVNGWKLFSSVILSFFFAS